MINRAWNDVQVLDLMSVIVNITSQGLITVAAA